MLALCGSVYAPLWCGLGLAGNVNSVIRGMYLGITCGLTQPWGILGVSRGYYRGLSFEKCKLHEWPHPGGATLPSGRK